MIIRYGYNPRSQKRPRRNFYVEKVALITQRILHHRYGMGSVLRLELLMKSTGVEVVEEAAVWVEVGEEAALWVEVAEVDVQLGVIALVARTITSFKIFFKKISLDFF